MKKHLIYSIKKSYILFLLTAGFGIKKEKLNKRFLLISLVLGLVVLMFNTAHLYGEFSDLTGMELLIACIFIGIAAEFAIFSVIYVGHRIAGAVFAIISFLVGMTFHNWKNPVFIMDPDNWREITFHPNKIFFATLLVQGGLSIVVWFLSELYVKILNTQEANQSLAKVKRQLATIQQNLATIKQEVANGNREITYIQGHISELQKTKSEMERTVENLKQEIRSLKNTKNAMSTKTQTL
jgi:ABC-type multidrug transport system fused ATPase/permease subunit